MDARYNRPPSQREPASAAEIREVVRQQPGRMTLQLARQLGVPEVEVVRALPGRVVELDVSRWEDLIRGLEPAGKVRVLVSNGAATMESVGCFGGFSTMGEFFNVQTPTLDLHIRWAELAAALAVEKPGHMDGRLTYSVQFFDRMGSAAFKVFFNFGEAIPADRMQLFVHLRETFASKPA